MLSVEVVVPRFTFLVENAEEVIQLLAEFELAAVKRRIDGGQGSYGPLPRPKDGGQPYRRTGQLYNSIGIKITRSARGPYAEIAPNREARDDSKGRARARRRRSRGARMKITEHIANRLERGHDISIGQIRAMIKGAGRRAAGGRFRHTNMDVAAILANRPKDKRGISGRRGIYTVFVSTVRERQEMRKIVELKMRAGLVDESGGRYTTGG